MNDFAGRVAIVTGAARGLGRAAAERLHERGASVAVTVRRKTEFPDWALVIERDITSPGAPEEIVNKTVQHFRRVDILVNNAALAKPTRFPDLTADEWRLALETNMTAPFLLIQACLPHMKAQKYGRIINISSTAGRTVSTLGGAHYTASKAGLLGLTRAAAKELGKFGITVNAICPGFVDTDMVAGMPAAARDAVKGRIPLGRFGDADEVARLVRFLCCEGDWITGAQLNINGGQYM
jgi:acetoacetyl-CoA reductase